MILFLRNEKCCFKKAETQPKTDPEADLDNFSDTPTVS